VLPCITECDVLHVPCLHKPSAHAWLYDPGASQQLGRGAEAEAEVTRPWPWRRRGFFFVIFTVGAVGILLVVGQLALTDNQTGPSAKPRVLL